MDLEELDEFEADTEVLDEEAEDWDEETLGLDWDEADTRTLVRDVVPVRGWAD